MSTFTRALWVFVVLGALAYLYGIATLSKAPNWDSCLGLLAAKQYEVGISETPRQANLVHPTQRDQVAAKYVAWWAPAYQMIPLGFRMTGLSWQNSLIASVFVFWSLGMLGWAVFLRRLCETSWVPPLVLLYWLCCYWNLKHILEYFAGDLLIWALVPWYLVLAGTLIRRIRDGVFERSGLWRLTLFAFAGMLLYFVKYSVLLIIVGICVVLAYELWRNRAARKVWNAWLLGLGSGFLLIVAWRFINPGYTPMATIFLFDGLAPLSAIRVPGIAMIGMSGMAAPISGTGIDTEHGEFWASLVGLVLAILFAIWLWLIQRKNPTLELMEFRQPYIRLAITVIAAELLLLAAMIFLGAYVFVISRLTRISGCLLLPLILDRLIILAKVAEVPLFRFGSAVMLLVAASTIFMNANRLQTEIRNVHQFGQRQMEDVRIRARVPESHTSFRNRVLSHFPQEPIFLACFPSDAMLLFPEQQIILTHDPRTFQGNYEKLKGTIAILVVRREFGRIDRFKKLFPQVEQWREVNIAYDKSHWKLFVSAAERK